MEDGSRRDGDVAASRRQAEAWLLALASQGIDARISREARGWVISTAPGDAERTARTLEAYETENATVAAPRVEVSHYGPTSAGLAVAAAFTGFFGITGPLTSGSVWLATGAADVLSIRAGEWWRVLTALTLHADLAHVLGNACFFAIFATAVCRSLGPGLGTLLILVAGALGNAAMALIADSLHRSVGASTAIFGAIGILAGMRMIPSRSETSGRRTAPWLPVAAALGLLAMIGMSERADLGAHLMGLTVGIPMGVAARWIWLAPPSAITQLVLFAGAAIAIAGAWLRALS